MRNLVVSCEHSRRDVYGDRIWIYVGKLVRLQSRDVFVQLVQILGAFEDKRASNLGVHISECTSLGSR